MMDKFETIVATKNILKCHRDEAKLANCEKGRK